MISNGMPFRVSIVSPRDQKEEPRLEPQLLGFIRTSRRYDAEVTVWLSDGGADGRLDTFLVARNLEHVDVHLTALTDQDAVAVRKDERISRRRSGDARQAYDRSDDHAEEFPEFSGEDGRFRSVHVGSDNETGENQSPVQCRVNVQHEVLRIQLYGVSILDNRSTV